MNFTVGQRITSREEDFLITGDDTTAALITDSPYREPMSIYKDEAAFYTDLFEQLMAAGVEARRGAAVQAQPR